MRIHECPREGELTQAIEHHRWSDDLRRHVEECTPCSELAEVAAVLKDDYARVLADARVPPAALVWWRSELAAKQEAAARATRPITLIHAIAVACVLGVGVAVMRSFIALRSVAVLEWSAAILETITSYRGQVAGTGVPIADSPVGIALLTTASVCLILAPVAAYFIFSDD